MPRVPTVDQQQTLNPLPNVGIEAQIRPEAFGAGLAEVGQQVGLALFSKWSREADEQAVLHAELQLVTAQTEFEQELLELRGRSAAQGNERIQKKWGEAVAGVSKSLSNARQRQAITKSAARGRIELWRVAERHAYEQAQVLADHEERAFLQRSRDHARLNAEKLEVVESEKVRQEDVVNRWAGRMGITGSESHLARMADETSKTNAEVVVGLLNNGLDMAAQNYYQRNKADFTSQDRDRVEKMVLEGSYRGDSRRQVQGWVEQGMDRKAMVAATEKIKDPTLADHVTQRLEHHWREQEVLRKEGEEVRYQDASRRVAQSVPGTLMADIVPEDEWLQLTAAERSALEAQRDERIRPEDRRNDNNKWLEFLSMPPDKVARLSRSDFETKYWTHFDNATRGRAEAQWNAAKDAATRPTDPKISSTLSFKDQVQSTLKLSGLIDPNKRTAAYSEAEVLLYARFEKEAATAVEQFERTELKGTRKASPEEIQTVINGVRDKAIKRVFIDRGFFSTGREVPAIDLTEDEKGRTYVPINKIPKDDLQMMTNYMLSIGKKATREKLRRAYGQYLLGNRAAFDQIANE